jgi:hypothetical protein
MSAVAFMAILSAACLNPVDFSPDQLPTFKVTGEIAIDNINSAELNFRNHTKSIDITKIDIFQTRTVKDTSTGGGTPQEEERLDARISGSPTAGAQDSVLVRPTGTNITNEITVVKYRIKVSYVKAQNFPEELNDLAPTLLKGDVEGELNELPRGRCVIHIYRNGAGEIKIDIEGIDDDPNYSDYYYDSDFVMNVKSQTKVDLSGLEVNVNLPPVTNTEVTFSQEILDAVNAAYSDIAGSIDNIATSINDLALSVGSSVESYLLFGKNTGLLAVMNWSSEPVSVEVPTSSTTSRTIGPVATGDLDGMLLSTNGGKTYNLKVYRGTTLIQTRNTFIFNQKVSYLHVYVDKSGTLVWDILDSPNRPEDAKPGYGRLRVKNYTNKVITNIAFYKKIGVGNDTSYDYANSFLVQKVSAASGSQYSSVLSGFVQEGNYAVYCTLEDGTVVFNDLDRSILADDMAYQAGDNVIEIRELPPPPSTIMYTVVADGGPTAVNAYTTTKLTINFSSSAVGAFTFTPVTMTSVSGSPVKIDDSTWEVPISNAVSEVATFTISGTDIDNAEHSVLIYKQDSLPPPIFIPVTDVKVRNDESFVANGNSKTIEWKVWPEDATNKTESYWTLGEMDANLLLKGFLWGGVAPYGLGEDGEQHTDSQGRLTVRSKYTNGYLYVAVVVKNGIAEGTRNPTPTKVGQTVVDKEGNTYSITIQALNYDPAKDFVKVFRFLKQ